MSGGLRLWQRRCISQAMAHYAVSPHFFCQATPGAGKTRMAAELAKRLLDEGKIDLVLCFAPSCQVVEGFRTTFSSVLSRRLDGRIGAIGSAYTYQAMEFRDQDFWQLFADYRVLAVFDEIHHCAGSDPSFSNAWGLQILCRIQDRAEFTLALSGTPWRTDDKGIALARYSTPDGQLICDYRYSLREAIADGVCRSPRIVLLDNNEVTLEEEQGAGSTAKLFSGVEQLLSGSRVTYEALVRHEEVIERVLDLGCRQLDELRQIRPDAAGLVVATDIEHAEYIARSLQARNETYSLVTNKTPNAQQTINRFRTSGSRWIVAVGMISEGTDIPRLQVCCYLSRIRTELHFRQVLGRVLRRSGEPDRFAWLFMLAEEKLRGFAERIADDLPDDLAVLSGVPTAKPTIGAADSCVGFMEDVVSGPSQEVDGEDAESGAEVNTVLILGDDVVEGAYKVSFSQHYRQQLLACF
tara:strand:+ start:672 stop:2072 length:1401 start_codon:yes stop_codon:yes gene_type:complete